MLSHNTQEETSSEEEPAVLSHRLSRRWKVLQVLGATLFVLAGLIDRWHFSDPTVPVTPLLFVMLGTIVFISGVAMQRAGSAGHVAK